MNKHLKNTIMKKLFIVITLFTVIAVSKSYAQSDLKIGYTNVDYVLNLLPEAKEIEAELTAYGKQLESQLQSKMAEFQEKLNDYQTKMSSGEMLPAVARDKETELNGPGPEITQGQQQQLIAKVQKMKKGDWFVLAGRLPDSIAKSFFTDIATLCNDNGIHFVLDTSGPALKGLIDMKPFLIKPNEQELGELFDTVIVNKQQAQHYAEKLVEKGVEHVIVSMGGEGALLVTKEVAVFAEAPKGKVVNTVGAGDSLVAGFLASFTNDRDPVKAFQLGVASGSATAFRVDLCEKKDVLELLDQVLISSLDKGM